MAFDGSIAIGGPIRSVSGLEEERMAHGCCRRRAVPTVLLIGGASFSALGAAFPLALGKGGGL